MLGLIGTFFLNFKEYEYYCNGYEGTSRKLQYVHFVTPFRK